MITHSNEIQIFLTNIKNLRINNNLTKTQMANKLKISVYKLNQIEKGILPPSITVDIIFMIYNEFHIKPKEQFELLNNTGDG